MPFRTLLVSLLLLAATSLPAQTTVLADVDHRQSQTLNGNWHYIVDPYDGGLYNFHREPRSDGYFLNLHHEAGDNALVEYDFSKSPTLSVPGDWNTQHEILFLYEGLLWYQRDFDFQPTPGHKTFLHIGAANYKSIFWINGQKVCDHEGGFTSFDCDASATLHPGKNFIVAAVDDTRLPDGVPTLSTDWYNYGGLTRDVSLVDVPATFIDDFDLHLNPARTAINGRVHIQGGTPGQPVTVSLPEAKLQITATLDATGNAPIHLPAPNLTLWSPAQPKLYRVLLKSGEDTLEDQIGFRTVSVDGTRILLNGQPIFLRGISIHAEAPYRNGRANNDEDAETLFSWAHELGCNYVRLAHYPHDSRMTRLADRLGILVWSEIPVYWAEHFADPAVLLKAQTQLTEEIRRDRNRASIILWSVANETPNTPVRTAFLKTLIADVRTQDPTRLVTAALLVRTVGNQKIVDDPLGASLDVIGANEYIGWYEGKPEDADTTTWSISYNKPLIISEFGADAAFGLHGPATERWTEEYQANLYRHQLAMLSRIPSLRGTSPWILMDFRSPNRQLPGVQDLFNRKGLLSNKGERKQAFYVLQQAYQDPTFGTPE